MPCKYNFIYFFIAYISFIILSKYFKLGTSNLDAAGSEPTNPGKVPNPSHGFILSNSMFIFILIISAV